MLASQIPFLEAQEELRQRLIKAPLTPERLKRLLLVTTGDEDYADKQAADLMAAQIRNETEAARVNR